MSGPALATTLQSEFAIFQPIETRGYALADHRLVIIEGIMGSGKSTTAQRVAGMLRAAGRAAHAVTEQADPHPVRASDDLADFFRPWQHACARKLADMALSKWIRFVAATEAQDAIPVLDGQLFHGDMTHLLLMEGSPRLIADYVRDLARVIGLLDPLVVYYWQHDVPQAIRQVCEQRGAKWLEYQVHWKLAAPYCVRRRHAGLEGLIALYADYRQLTDRLFEQLPLRKIAIENSGRDYPAYEARIAEALGLSCVPSPASALVGPPGPTVPSAS
jgi:hypothetical protein